MLTTNELRTTFLKYFQKQGHAIVSSSSLIPANDPTLLFTNAGMVQFKDIFLGLEHRTYTKATSSQRCLRVSGKHNDFESVGYTMRHHTFFEMLGNFSFGDYFKREAINYAWDFLTNVLQIPKKRLLITVFEQDNEAADIWLKEIGIDFERFIRCGMADNFWAMAETGPCGPCSEIFYDYGEGFSGNPPGGPGSSGDRYTEIWNLVFMQFNRDIDGTLTPLPKPSIDTGMGLERLATVVQGVHSNYDIDIFQHLIQKAAILANCQDLQNTSLKVLADHIRACTFLVMDGILPSNEGRGYVLRRIIRRAIRHGNKLGMQKLFFHKLVEPVVEIMGSAYRELMHMQNTVERVLFEEEEQFTKTLTQGLNIFEQIVASLKDKVIPGMEVFKLYDTYGFPVDLTADIARERGLAIDEADFIEQMEKQRQQSKAASRFKEKYGPTLKVDQITEFIGYDTSVNEANVMAIIRDDQYVDVLNVGERGSILLDRTPFYAESGGQVGDKGKLSSSTALFQVQDTQKKGSTFLHIGVIVSGSIYVGDVVYARIDLEVRKAIASNHSATHLMHAALRQVLGDHVLQKGSFVDSERLRLDFSHPRPVAPYEIQMVEDIVNSQIQDNCYVETQIMSPDEAKEQGAMAIFGEKYGEKARVVRMDDFSIELCGGTHIKQTGNIGIFKVTAETGIAAGIRRIEATTGKMALKFIHHQEDILRETCSLLKTHKDALVDQLKQSLVHQRELEKTVIRLQTERADNLSVDLIKQAKDINGIKVLSVEITDIDLKGLRNILDKLKSKLKRAVIVLALVQDDEKVSLIANVTKDCTDQFQADKLVKFVAEQVDGKGGGKADIAQGAGTNPAKLKEALQSVEGWVRGIMSE